jgi:hypothetical protein
MVAAMLASYDRRVVTRVAELSCLAVCFYAGTQGGGVGREQPQVVRDNREMEEVAPAMDEVLEVVARGHARYDVEMEATLQPERALGHRSGAGRRRSPVSATVMSPSRAWSGPYTDERLLEPVVGLVSH